MFPQVTTVRKVSICSYVMEPALSYNIDFFYIINHIYSFYNLFVFLYTGTAEARHP